MIIKLIIKKKRIKIWTFWLWAISYHKTMALGQNANSKISNYNMKFC